MTLATETLRPIKDRPSIETSSDQLITFQGDWAQFKLIQQGCGQNSNVRLFYFNGTIEILMPARSHEIFSHVIGQLLTFFLAYQGISFFALGTADQESEGIAAAQPDQSYCIGTIKLIPDLSIEIVFTSGGLTKLQRYKALGVAEVWFWEDGTLKLYSLQDTDYIRIEQSHLEGLKNLDLTVFKRHILMAETDIGEAVRSFTTYVLQKG
jgi:Uma2 family endonuclease